MGFTPSALENLGRILSEFNGASTISLGDIVLPIQAGSIILNVQFSMVEDLSPFNAIMRRTWLGMATGGFGTGHPYHIPIPNPGWGGVGWGIPILIRELKLKSHPRLDLTRVCVVRVAWAWVGLGNSTCLTINCQFLTLEHKTNWACHLWSRPKWPGLYIIVQDRTEAFISIISFVPYGPNIKPDYGHPLVFLWFSILWSLDSLLNWFDIQHLAKFLLIIHAIEAP